MVEGARLESVYTGNGIAGSNPALSAFRPPKLHKDVEQLEIKQATAGFAFHSTRRASADEVRINRSNLNYFYFAIAPTL